MRRRFGGDGRGARFAALVALALAASVAVACPASASAVDLQQVTTTAPTMHPGQTAWVSVAWTAPGKVSNVAVTVIAEAGLSFIGLGAQPPLPSLGQMISEGRNFLYVNPWTAILPGGTIALIVLGLNTLGDGLRDIFDPRLRRW